MATRARAAAADIEETAGAGINGSSGEAAEDIEEISERLADLEDQLRVAGERLRESAKVLSGVASRQMQLHPLAAFGVAFFAGIAVARILRR